MSSDLYPYGYRHHTIGCNDLSHQNSFSKSAMIFQSSCEVRNDAEPEKNAQY